jgi:hypothetical protein
MSTQGLFAEALSMHRRAIQLQPNYAEAHYALGMLLLLMGQYAEGWREYEWRWMWNGFSTRPRQLGAPQWNGAPLGGSAILIHAEQGFGDTLQFIRYVKMVMERGGRPVIECPPQLVRLVRTIREIEHVDSDFRRLPKFSAHCPLLSLPMLFDTRLETIPRSVPYLHVDPDSCRKWQEKLGATRPLRVGLAWAGNPRNRNNRNRSVELRQLAVLGEVKGIEFYSLQIGKAAKEENAKGKSPPNLLNFTDELTDFADTAGLIANLDLVISVETAVAHLAGAMGKETWVMVEQIPDWRWLLDREDSPWYPTMRLFRQRIVGNWSEVIDRVKGELESFQRRTGRP